VREPSNRWLQRRVLAYAHQGGAREGPSSTLHAIRAALDAGATGIELDVHASADGELVVCHDPTVDRTTNGRGAIATLSLAELRVLDNAYWFVPGEDAVAGREEAAYPLRGRAPGDHRCRVATLREVLEELPGVVVNLDIKQTAPTVAPYEELLARLLAEFDRTDDVIVASFSDAALAAFRALAPSVGTSAGLTETAAFWRAVHQGAEPPSIPAVALQVPERFGDTVVVDEAFVAAAHEAGMAVHVWTVDDPASMDQLLDAGVDGIMSDVPSVLCRVLAARGAAWGGMGARSAAPDPAGAPSPEPGAQPRPELGRLP
jgi:glycerophosphoryl diester phosphodiesterase